MSAPAPPAGIARPGPGDAERDAPREGLAVYALLGVWFGIVAVKSEVVSWFRIQEMFRFDAFHMYGIIGSAVVVAGVSIALMKRAGTRTSTGAEIAWPDPAAAVVRPNHVLGGLSFGLGWGLVGACPGPIYALLGTGAWVMAVVLLSAVAGAWAYGLLRPRLPH